jgi:hypothetical protein
VIRLTQYLSTKLSMPLLRPQYGKHESQFSPIWHLRRVIMFYRGNRFRAEALIGTVLIYKMQAVTFFLMSEGKSMIFEAMTTRTHLKRYLARITC